MTKRLLPLCLVAVALVLLAGAPGLAADDKKAGDRPAATGDTHEGIVVSVTGNKLVMRGKEGAEAKEHTHTLAPNARVMCDGKECKLEDLKPGQRIRVTTARGDRGMATRVEALDKNRDFSRTGTEPGRTINPDKNP